MGRLTEGDPLGDRIGSERKRGERGESLPHMLPAGDGHPPGHSRDEEFAVSRDPTATEPAKPPSVAVPSPRKRPDAVLRYPYSEEALRKELDRKMALIETLDHPGWDTHSADPLNRDSMADARRFLGKRPSDVPLPFAQINSDGQVGFYWDTEDMHASVCFEGNGLLSHYTWQANPGGVPVEHLGDDVPFSEGWPAVVTDVLRNL